MLYFKAPRFSKKRHTFPSRKVCLFSAEGGNIIMSRKERDCTAYHLPIRDAKYSVTVEGVLTNTPQKRSSEIKILRTSLFIFGFLSNIIVRTIYRNPPRYLTRYILDASVFM